MYCVEKNMPDYVIFESHTSHLIACDYVIHLKLSDYGELRKRLKLRGYVSDKIQSNVDSEIFEVISDEISCLNRIEIETKNKSIEQVFLEVLTYIESIAQHKMYKDF
jgi:broad-specificity NMP kinase